LILLHRVATGIASVIEWATKILVAVPASAALVMTVLISINVLLRYVLRNPLAFEFELVQVMLVGFIWLSQGYVFYKERYISVDVITSRFSWEVRTTLKIFGAVLSILYFGLVTKIGWDMALESFTLGIRSGYVSRFPVAPQQLILPVGAGLACLQLSVMVGRYSISLARARQRSRDGKQSVANHRQAV